MPSLTPFRASGDMYRNSFYYLGQYLGSVLVNQEDPFKALAEGREKAKGIAAALRVKIPTLKAGDIEIRSTTYDAQFSLIPELERPPQTLVWPQEPTLSTMKPGPVKEES